MSDSMGFFTYDQTSSNAPNYELLNNLMENWENEIVEFKAATGEYNTDKAGRYFSAISNEANLKHQQYGWFIMGVSEVAEKHLVGTNFKKGDPILLERFKDEISKNITDGATYLDIIELFPKCQGQEKRVLMFKIPAAAAGLPTAWKTRYYARSGDSCTLLSQMKIDAIRGQQRVDWSKQTLPGANLSHLDKEAIALARKCYIEKMNRPHITEEVEQMSDAEFLTKMKLLINGNVTTAAMILLGNPDCDYLFQTAPEIMWRLYGADNSIKDYEIFTVPFIAVVDKIFLKIRNLVYRYMPNQLSLFPNETQQYDGWMLRELLNNCIAHSNYQLGGRIYIDEFEDQIKIVNPGDFLPKDIKTVLQPGYNPPYYRNQLLAISMVHFNMIDTATSGIQKVFRIQRDKYFPMPDYDLSSEAQVSVRIYGKVLNESYVYILYNHPDLSLDTVFLLDCVQKGIILNKDAVAFLRKQRLIEGRYPKVYLSAGAAREIADEAGYIRNKAFNDQYYKDLIYEYLKKYKKAKKKDIRALLWDKLPDILSDEQKENKVSNLLSSMKAEGIIDRDSENQQTGSWILLDKK